MIEFKCNKMQKRIVSSNVFFLNVTKKVCTICSAVVLPIVRLSKLCHLDSGGGGNRGPLQGSVSGRGPLSQCWCSWWWAGGGGRGRVMKLKKHVEIDVTVRRIQTLPDAWTVRALRDRRTAAAEPPSLPGDVTHLEGGPSTARCGGSRQGPSRQACLTLSRLCCSICFQSRVKNAGTSTCQKSFKHSPAVSLQPYTHSHPHTHNACTCAHMHTHKHTHSYVSVSAGDMTLSCLYFL